MATGSDTEFYLISSCSLVSSAANLYKTNFDFAITAGLLSAIPTNANTTMR